MQGKGKRECGHSRPRGSSLSLPVISHARIPPSFPPLSAYHAGEREEGMRTLERTWEFPFSPRDLTRPNSPFLSAFKRLSCRGKGRENADTREHREVPFLAPCSCILHSSFKRLSRTQKKKKNNWGNSRNQPICIFKFAANVISIRVHD